jgi:hypothetical protein
MSKETPSADRRGEGFAFFHWHRFHRSFCYCERWQHSYHLAFWRWGSR